MITKQSTARTILVGPVLDSTGAAKTDEVVGSIKITKNGTVGAADGSATLTHNHAGKYLLALTANDCDTVGVLEISLNSGTNDMPVKGLNVVETAIWDALFADGATGFASIADQTAIKAKTDNLPSDPADQSVIIAATDAILTAVATRSTQTSVDAIQTDTNDIQTRLPAALESGRIAAALDSATLAKIDDILTDTGTTLPGLINAIEGGGGSGTGARTVTITVNDGTTVLQNATVRMTEGANTFTALTNVSGVAVFNLDDATYTVGVTKSGYTYAGTTLVVDGTEVATYSMTAVSITPPSNPSLSAIVVLCLDAAGQPEADVEVDFRIVTVPSGSQNIAYKGAKQTATSDVDGIARFEAVQGITGEWKRGRADVWTSVAVDSDSVTNVTSVIGSP